MDKYSFKAKWYNPDNSPPSSRQTSIRLPILASARIDAICEMFPNKTKSAILNDLIVQALEMFIDELEPEPGKEISDDEDGICYEDIGESGRFTKLTQKYLNQYQEDTKEEDKVRIEDPVYYVPHSDLKNK
ncbi:hypothetical protein [Desulfobacter latus]|uniref:Uncharacterized protein n=1 Tax=Desulfobacter latus TaxID=2292 RepID=A0A850T000_9BACT|nr:hypothetical protein [Desulfobacter latus]NWH06854.1 hypothetical protein [Desulfobacter latus]